MHAWECNLQFYSNTIFIFFPPPGPSHPLGAQGGCTLLMRNCGVLLPPCSLCTPRLYKHFKLNFTERFWAWPCLLYSNDQYNVWEIDRKTIPYTPLRSGDMIPSTLEIQQDLAVKYSLVQEVEFDNPLQNFFFCLILLIFSAAGIIPHFSKSHSGNRNQETKYREQLLLT